MHDFLFPETLMSQDGGGPAIGLGPSQGQPLKLTLGITRIIEQESLDVSVCGSVDGVDWGVRPLLVFPQKFYCGLYPVALDLSAHPEVQYLRVQWKMSRWGRGESTPLFCFYVFAEPVGAMVGAGA